MTDLNKIIDELSKLTVVEAAELSKQLEEKWGVTAASHQLQLHQLQQQQLKLKKNQILQFFSSNR